MSEATAGVRHELAQTRARMSATVETIESRIATDVGAITARVDIAEVIRDHPWTALGAAVAAGLVLARTGADAKAANAAMAAGKKAALATAGAVGGGASIVGDAIAGTPERARDIAEQLRSAVIGLLRRPVDDFVDQLRTASRP